MLAVLVLGFLSVTVYGQYLSAIPAVIPLIHKAPYVNVWIATGGNISTLVGHWPQFFNGRSLGWMIAARVDGAGYMLQGVHANYTASTVIGAFITPTRTIFTMDAGPVRLNLTFLTPIEMDDWVQHSLPFGYLSIDLWSNDGKPHSVQLYSDVSGEFVSPYPTDTLNWRTTANSTLIYHQAVARPSVSKSTVSEDPQSDLTQDGTQFFAFRATPGVAATWQSCHSEVCRNRFAQAGTLENTSDTNFRAINDSLPVMAFALDLGNVTQSASPLVCAIGLFRNATILYLSGDAKSNFWREQLSLWRTRWSTIWDAVDRSLSDFPQILSRAATLDTRIISVSPTLVSKFALPTSAIADLTDLAIMSVRQTIGSLEITTSRKDQGPVGLADVRVFMKDMGNSRRVNPLEVIYAAFPAFLYFNSSLAGKLLEPLFEANDTGKANPNNLEHAKLDLGAVMPFTTSCRILTIEGDTGDGWPSARANTSLDYSLGVESSSSMLILALAHAQKAGDKTLISRYYNSLFQWADFLVKFSLDLNGFTTADGPRSVYAMSNLALKGITGIYAMGRINQLLEGSVSGADANRTSYYLGEAQNQARRWETLTLSSNRDHLVSVFGDDSTGGLLYNLYAVQLIGADFISPNVYGLQTSWSSDQQNLIKGRCQVQRYENTDFCSKTHWALLAAASISQDTTGTRDTLISRVHNFTFSKGITFANPSTCCEDDAPPGAYRGNGSAAIGAAFAFHALSLPDVFSLGPIPPSSSTPPHHQPNNNNSSSNNGSSSSATASRLSFKLAITLPPIIALLILLGGFFYWYRLRKQHRQRRMKSEEYYKSPESLTTTTTGAGDDLPPAQPTKHRAALLLQSTSTSTGTDDDDNLGDTNTSSSGTGPSGRSNIGDGSSSGGTQQAENLRRQLELLRIELDRAREDAIPPPYMDGI